MLLALLLLVSIVEIVVFFAAFLVEIVVFFALIAFLALLLLVPIVESVLLVRGRALLVVKVFVFYLPSINPAPRPALPSLLRWSSASKQNTLG